MTVESNQFIRASWIKASELPNPCPPRPPIPPAPNPYPPPGGNPPPMEEPPNLVN